MHIPLDSGSMGAGAGRRSGRLVLGYQGTLRPEPGSAAGEAERICIREIPVEPWMESAQREIARRLGAEQRDCQGGCIDYSEMAAALRERLTGILTQALIAFPDGDGEELARMFPALAALMRGAAAEWVEAIAVFHRRLHRDRLRLAAWLGYAKLPAPAAVTPGGSDAHTGHSVLRLVFPDGCCVYYKPRPVTGEWLWDRLVQAVNADSSLALVSARALAGCNGRYGWIMALQPRGQDGGWGEAAGYWHRAGATLCLAAQARMTDLHMANVVATPHGPAPVDAETLGSPRALEDSDAAGGEGGALAAVIDRLLDTGLLPGQKTDDLPDVSGLFGQAAVAPGILVPCWSRARDGAHRLSMAASRLVDQGNAPPVAAATAVLPHLVSGYREAAEALLRCRERLLAPGSEWRWTLEHLHAPRILVRDTLTYGLLLSETLEAEPLESAQHRRMMLRKALRSRGQTSLPAAVLRNEFRSLLGLHIPRFTALPGTRTLAASGGRALSPGYLSCPPAEAVLRGIGELSAQGLSEMHVPGLLLTVLRPPS